MLRCHLGSVSGWFVVCRSGLVCERGGPAGEGGARTAGKWVARYRSEGSAGLLDRSSAPLFVANRCDESTIEVIATLRRLRLTGPEISEVLELPFSTVSGILKRIGMGRLGRVGLEPADRREEARTHPGRRRQARDERQAQPKSSRLDRDGIVRRRFGREHVHRHRRATRLAHAEVLTDEKATTAIAFLRRAIAFYERHGMHVQEL
jgi:hypothetical protein